jgi:hypothetical protein
MEQIKRYRLQSEMSQFYQGEYVKHADHLAQVKAVLAEQPVQPPAGVEAGLVGRMLLVYDRTYDGKSGCHNRAMAAAAAVALEGMMSLDDVEKAIRVTMKDLGHPLRDGSYVAAEVRARLAKPAEQTDEQKVEAVVRRFGMCREEAYPKLAAEIVDALKGAK